MSALKLRQHIFNLVPRRKRNSVILYFISYMRILFIFQLKKEVFPFKQEDYYYGHFWYQRYRTCSWTIEVSELFSITERIAVFPWINPPPQNSIFTSLITKIHIFILSNERIKKLNYPVLDWIFREKVWSSISRHLFASNLFPHCHWTKTFTVIASEIRTNTKVMRTRKYWITYFPLLASFLSDWKKFDICREFLL